MKLVRVITLLVVSILWLGGCSQPVMHWLYQTSIIVDDYRYGDLYRLSNLPQFKDPVTLCPAVTVSSDTARTHLYVIGDSFTEPERLSQQDFPVSYYKRVRWDKQDTIQLDPTANNVLLVESVERHFREHAAATPIDPIDNLFIVSDSNRTNGSKQQSPSFGKQLVDLIHSEGIEERLETVLFSHDVFLWFKEIKASLTMNAFNRVSPNVAVSQNKKHLFIALDTDSTKRLNAGTSPLPDNEVADLVNTVNKAAVRYQALGFDKVVLSIVPNKATILEPDRQPYNHLIERVQHHPKLNVPIVDVYSLYRKQNQSVYALGDSHWNCLGRSIWIKAVSSHLN
ncbi:hypothetical protein [Fibrella forsythiae]|uniref:AlgX/AlgJ SGNH hydrolase-like domain-containing protein n=1 Tax=Fibrella forsythiae TaxID=2817061 RepID=A0ABS3JBN5_9BACT|nr:hypothetical protein [Fibrella forsythiae]MBO0947392.1 hypothetical protein [Fibrella forsythiae]